MRPQFVPDGVVLAANVAGEEVSGRLGRGTDDAGAFACLSLVQRGADKVRVSVPQDRATSLAQLLLVPRCHAQPDLAWVQPHPRRRPRIRPLGYPFSVVPNIKRSRIECTCESRPRE